jgi:hypothetical protein
VNLSAFFVGPNPLPMSKTGFQDYICRPFCDFFKPGIKEELTCRGALLVEQMVRRRRLTPRDFHNLDRNEPLFPDQEADLEAAVCWDCPFRAEDCDFQSANPPADCRPCGGLVLLRQLRKKGLISISDLLPADE